MKSKHMSEQGKGHVAKALECQDSSIRAAYKSVGDPCIEDMPRVASNGGTPVMASVAPIVPVVVQSRAQCIRAAESIADYSAYKAATAQCPAN
jgi:hypothetical protein